MDTLALTKNQEKAVAARRRSVCISSGAGCGKTELLVRRFCHLVERGMAAVDEILTVAFTERSANEIRERIARRFADLGREHDRRAVHTAYIGTVHGFCSRILRENPFEVGVGPHFSILGDTGRRVITDRILDEIVQAAQDDPAARDLLQEIGPDAARNAVLSVYRRIRALGRRPSVELIASASEPGPFLETFQRCYDELLLLAETADEPVAEMVDGVKRGLFRALTSAARLACPPDGQDFDWEDFQRVRRYSARFRVPRGSSPAVRQQIEAVRDALSDFLAACLDRLSCERAVLLLRLIVDFDDRYASAKAQLGLLDYDDLLDKARELLCAGDGRPTEAARRYWDRFKYIMLADSQDISRLQRQVLDAVSRPDNVLVIGDAKQSIFGFMHGDAGFFLGDYEQAGDRRALTLPLQENFRSRRGIVAFVNHLFGEVWGESPDVEYEELKSAGRFAAKSTPDVELVLLPRFHSGLPDGEGIQLLHRDEARAIAHRILEITGRAGSAPLYHTKAGRVGQPVEFRDIVLLLRATTGMHIYERTLEEYGVDTCAVSGRGFCDAREVRDVLSLLQAVNDPLDDIAMAEVLRSPFAGVSSDALAQLCAFEPESRHSEQSEESPSAPAAESSTPVNLTDSSSGQSSGKLWQALQRLEDIPDVEEPDRRKLSAFRDLMSALLDVRPGSAITDALDLALERSRFDTRILAMRDGARKYANVRRLYEIAREFQADGAFELSDFMTHVRENEHLAEPGMEAADAVRIMTIHRARRLQAPVVFVADLSRNLGSKPGLFVFDRDRGLAAQVANPLAGEFEVPLCHRETFAYVHDKDVSEEKRLLYTAATRAEEHLVLVGSSDLRGEYKSTYHETDSWSGWLEKAFGLGPGSPERELHVGGCRVRLRYGPLAEAPVSEAAEDMTLAGRFAFEFRAGRPIEKLDIPPAAGEIARSALDRCLPAELPAVRHIPRLSVSRALDYLECPARYRLLHIVGMPEEGAEPPEDAEDREFTAADLGHLVHDLLARIDFSADAAPQLPVLISEIADDALRAQAQPLLEGFARSQWCRELRASDRILRETPFELAIEGRALAGRMDVLYRGRDGWTMLDYKTGRAEDRERYELQVGIYAHVAERLIGEMPVRTALILLSTGDDWVQDTSDGTVARLAAEKIGEVAAAIEAGHFSPTPGKACGWCALSACCSSMRD